jgi:hypothetical protein
MKRLPVVPVAALALVLASTGARAGPAADPASDPPAGALLYLDQAGWREAAPERKIALAADFMRIYCGNPAMPASSLVVCLDRSADSGPLFAQALSCVAAEAAVVR